MRRPGVGSQIQQQAARVFQRFLDADEEGHGALAVDDAVIVAQRQIHHRADHDLAVHHDRAILDLVHAEDARLRRVQDRRGHQRAVDAAVRDGEGAALHFRHGQLAVTGALALLGDRLLDVGKRHLVGVADHRNDEARGRAGSDAHVDVVLVDDIAAVDLGVDFRHFLQRVAAGLGEEGHEAHADAVLLLERVLVLVAQRHDRGHVDLVIGRQHRGGVLRILQAAGDGGAQARHLHPFLAGGVVRRDRGARRRGRGGRDRDGRSGGSLGGSGGDVFLHDPAVAAGAGDLRGGEAGFGHRLLRGGRILDVLAGGRGGRGGGSSRGRGGGSGDRTGGAFGHDGELRRGGDGRALGGDDLGQHAGDGRGNLDRDLVGFKLAQHLVLRDRVAHFLEPGGNRGFRHALAQGGHHHVRHLDLFGLLRGRLRGCRAFGFGLRGGRRGARFVDRGEKGIHAHRLALGGDDLGQHTRGGGRNLDGHLVGLELAQHLVGGDRVTRLLEPGGDGGFRDAFAKRGDTDLDCHGSALQRVVDERVLLGLVAFRQAGGRRGRGIAAGIARTRVLGVDLRQHPLDVRLDEGPGALVLRLFLAPDHLGVLEARELGHHRMRRERVELFETQDVDILEAALVAFGQQVVIDLARADHHALDLVVGGNAELRVALLARIGVVPHHPTEERAGGEFLGLRGAQRVTQKRLRRHQDQRLAEVAVDLPAQDVEIVRRGRAVRHDPVVFRRKLQEAFETGRAVLGALALEAVRQQADEARHAQPLAFARVDELVEHDLRAVGEVAELGFPQGKRVRFSQRIAILEAEHRIFRQHRVDDLVTRLTRLDVVERVVAFFGGLVDEGGMPLREGAAGAVLAGQAHREPLGEQRAEGQRLGGRPVEAGAGLEHLLLRLEQARHGLVDVEAVGMRGQRLAKLGQLFGRDRGDAGVIVLRLPVEVLPAPVEPVGLVRLERLADLEFLVQLRLEGGLHVLDLAFRDQPVGNETLGIELQRGLVALDALVHLRVGEHRLVAFVVTEAAIAEDVDDHVLVELLAELGRHLGSVHHCFRIVAVHMEDRGFHHQRDVGRVGRGAREMRRGGEADLVVHHDVDGAAGAVAADARELEAFRHHALTGEGRVTMQQHRQHLGAVGVVELVLLRAHLAKRDRVHRLEVAGVRGQRQVDGVLVEGAVGRGAEVIFHVARTVDIVGLVGTALEFVEDRPVGLHHHVGQHAQPAAVRHAEDHLFQAEVAAALDDLFHRRDQRFAAIKAEALGAHVFHVQELLEALGLDQLVQDGAAAFPGELDLLAVALDPLLQPAGFLGVRDVHVLQREGAAIGALQHVDDLPHRGDLQAEHVVDEDRAVHVGIGEAVGLRVELGVARLVTHVQRVEIGDQVAADTIGADDHDRAHRVEHGALHRVFGHLHAGLGGLRLDLVAGGLGFLRRHHRPFAGQRAGQVVIRARRPVGTRPGRALRRFLHVKLVVAERGEEGGPGGVDRARVGGEAGVELFDVIRVRALQEARGFELFVGGLVIHDGCPWKRLRGR
ncbi:hypothetical protein SDC9_19983 [bioreactor metagenome]|uniref:NAD-specific glutamate dehydrogenase n=1 Tax=bioreactor metagenome TaxID=1076179 RepID=A0A644U5K6_9ZZZZ